MQLDKAIKERHSVRKFKKKKPNWRTIIECIDSARYAPMAGNIFTLRFILVDNPAKIQKITEAAQQSFISQASYVVAVCSDTSKITNAYEKSGEKWSRQQAGAGIQNFLLKIQEAGLATCWVGHFYEDQIKRELKIPDEVNLEAIFPIGYEYDKPAKQKKKIDLDRVLYFHEYENTKMKNPKKLDV